MQKNGKLVPVATQLAMAGAVIEELGSAARVAQEKIDKARGKLEKQRFKAQLPWLVTGRVKRSARHIHYLVQRGLIAEFQMPSKYAYVK